MKVRLERWTQYQDRSVQDVVEYEFDGIVDEREMVELVRRTRAVFDGNMSDGTFTPEQVADMAAKLTNFQRDGGTVSCRGSGSHGGLYGVGGGSPGE